MAPSQGEPESLSYFTAEKLGFLVISLSGILTKSTSARLDDCREEVAKAGASRIVISFHDISRVEIGGMPALVRLMQTIRVKPAELRVCFLRKEIFETLERSSVIRSGELTTDLKEALQSFH